MMHESSDANQSLLFRAFGVILFILAIFLVSILVLIFVHQVSLRINPLDALTLKWVVGADIIKQGVPPTYDEQVDVIRAVQDAVFRVSPVYKAIPKGEPREPADLMGAGHGYCFDRARSIDKALRHIGFKTRYASLYSINKTGSPWKSLLTKGGDDVRSHAAVEVLTTRGWLVVDTVNRWLAQRFDGSPIGFADLEDGTLAGGLDGDIYPLYKAPFTTVYGLYSRHGMAYPPYNRVPDINLFEMRYNLFP